MIRERLQQAIPETGIKWIQSLLRRERMLRETVSTHCAQEVEIVDAGSPSSDGNSRDLPLAGILDFDKAREMFHAGPTGKRRI